MIPFDRTGYDGFIFDCDGTLADSMPAHYRAWTETLGRMLGCPAREITWSLFQTCGGIAGSTLVERWNREFRYGLPVEETVEAKAEAFLNLLGEVRPIPEVLATLKALPKGSKVAVASGGLSRVIVKIVEHLGLTVGAEGEVQAVVCTDQVAHGKPWPDLFLRAADLLTVRPERCLVFEDAESGFQAARVAGMDFIDVRAHVGSEAGAGKM